MYLRFTNQESIHQRSLKTPTKNVHKFGFYPREGRGALPGGCFVMSNGFSGFHTVAYFLFQCLSEHTRELFREGRHLFASELGPAAPGDV